MSRFSFIQWDISRSTVQFWYCVRECTGVDINPLYFLMTDIDFERCNRFSLTPRGMLQLSTNYPDMTHCHWLDRMHCMWICIFAPDLIAFIQMSWWSYHPALCDPERLSSASYTAPAASVFIIFLSLGKTRTRPGTCCQLQSWFGLLMNGVVLWEERATETARTGSPCHRWTINSTNQLTWTTTANTPVISIFPWQEPLCFITQGHQCVSALFGLHKAF